MTQSLSDIKMSFNQYGVAVVNQMFSEGECLRFFDHFMNLRKNNTYPDDATGDNRSPFPRMLNMHRWDSVAMNYLFDNRITSTVEYLMDEDFLGMQTMFYAKSPGSRGQAWHMDAYFFKAPAIAAWLALDDARADNGCLNFVNERCSSLLPVREADPEKSFTNIEVDIEEKSYRPLEVKKGDVIFFDGLAIHGSEPNKSNGFRSSLIAHYTPVSTTKIAVGYNPVYGSNREQKILEEI